MTAQLLENLIVSAVSLARCSGKPEGCSATPEQIGSSGKRRGRRVLEGIKVTERVMSRSANDWRKHILWVDDRPDNNIYERRAFESMGIEFRLALSSHQALNILSNKRFAAIIALWAQSCSTRLHRTGKSPLALTNATQPNIEHWHSEIETDQLGS